MAIYERMAIQDIQAAAESCGRFMIARTSRDGYVSLEVSPFLANDTQGTIEEARRLWKAVEPPQPDGQGPGDRRGIPAIQTADQRRHQHQRHAAVRARRV